MQRKRRVVTLACGLSLAMVAAACGGDDTDEAGSPTTAGGGASTASTATTAAGATSSTAAPAAQPTSIAEWEALWAEERAAIIQRIQDNGWGKSADGTTLTGPGGWTVDLSQCPAGWSDTEGVTDTSIKIGASLSLSGTYADYGNYGVGIKYLFDYYNEQRFFEDAEGMVRNVEYIVKDDAYDTARAIPNVDELLDSDKAFAIWTLGTPSTLRTYDKINERCVPHPLAITFHSAWGDPVNHPWTTGAPNPTYSTEAILWGSFIEQRLDEFPDDQMVTVASLVQNNDFGKLYDVTFRAYLEQSDALRDRVEYVSETVEASAPTVTDPMTSLAAEDPDVYISMLGGAHCTQTVLEAAQNGMKDTTEYLFLGQGCTGASWIGRDKLGGDGSAGDGWWVISNGVKDMRDPAFADDPYVEWLREGMEAEGIDPEASVNIGGGINFAFPVAQALVIAGQLEGGVTRTNFQLAMRAMDMTSPMLLEGIRLKMDGVDDPYIVEAGLFQTWDATNQTYVRQGDIIDLEGVAEPCAWDQATGSCA